MTLKDRALSRAAWIWDTVPASVRRTVLRASNDHFLVGVVGLVCNEERRLLVLRHRFRTPWKWGLPGGFLNHGETFGAGLRRELMEEVGLEIEVTPGIFDIELNVEARFVSVTLVAKTVGGTLDLGLSSEILDGGFYGPDELPEGTYPLHADIIHSFCNGADRPWRNPSNV